MAPQPEGARCPRGLSLRGLVTAGKGITTRQPTKKPACGVAAGRHRLEWSSATPYGAALRNGGGCRGEPPAKERASASE